MKLEREMMRGAGPTAVMQLLAAGEMYGYELVEAITQRSSGVLEMGQSTLYPMLYNLEAKGLVTSRQEVAKETGRPRRYYRLTGKGKRKLKTDKAQWAALLDAMRGLGITSGTTATATQGGAS